MRVISSNPSILVCPKTLCEVWIWHLVINQNLKLKSLRQISRSLLCSHFKTFASPFIVRSLHYLILPSSQILVLWPSYWVRNHIGLRVYRPDSWNSINTSGKESIKDRFCLNDNIRVSKKNSKGNYSFLTYIISHHQMIFY